MARQLEGTVALVTGASSGIGEATAVALAAEGATVTLAARRRDRLEQVVERIGNDADVLVIETDITDEAAARAMVKATVTEFGRLDTVVNNAGVMLLGPIVDAPVEEWKRMVQLNLLGLLYTTHAALPHLLDAAEPGAPPRGRPGQRELGGRPGGPLRGAGSTTPPSTAWAPSRSPCARR